MAHGALRKTVRRYGGEGVWAPGATASDRWIGSFMGRGGGPALPRRRERGPAGPSPRRRASRPAGTSGGRASPCGGGSTGRSARRFGSGERETSPPRRLGRDPGGVPLPEPGGGTLLPRALRVPLFALLLLLFPARGPAKGGTQVRTETSVDEEIAFARALASELGYFDLATERLERLLREKLSADEERRVALVSCSLLGLAAERELDRRRRLEFLSLAVRRLGGFLARHGDTAATLPARLDRAEAAASRGRFLAEEIRQMEEGESPTAGVEAEVTEILREDPAGKDPPADPREALVAAADWTFAIAVRESSRLLAAIEEIPERDRSEQDRVALFRAWYAKGTAYHDWALAA